MKREITQQFRAEYFGSHLGECAGLTVEFVDEDTQEANLSCPHGLRSAFEYETDA